MITVQTKLTIDKGFSWIRDDFGGIKGYMFDAEGKAVDLRQLARNLETKTTEEIVAFLRAANGCFSFVLETPRFVFAAVDRLRTMPLFYAARAGVVVIGDDANEIKSVCKLGKLDRTSTHMIKKCGYVLGGKTATEDLFQIEAGRLLVINKRTPSVELETYFEYVPLASTSDEKGGTWVDRIHMAYESAFDRMVASLDGRPVVLPLSGGFDSRLIAMALKKRGHQNVTCFTYGRPGNKEAERSRKIADLLGFPWHFIDYHPDKLVQWFGSASMSQYFRFSGRQSVLPYSQDWGAVHELIEKKAVSERAVFIPGHSGDFLTGSHIPSFLFQKSDISKKALLGILNQSHFYLWPSRRSEKSLDLSIDESLSSFLGMPAHFEAHDSIALLEKWDWKERQAKYICNSVRVYEYFGFEWRMPYWDAELIDIWLSVPYALKQRRALFFAYLEKYISPELPADLQSHVLKKSEFREKIKQQVYTFGAANQLLRGAKAVRNGIRYKHTDTNLVRMVPFKKYATSLLNGGLGPDLDSILVKRYLDVL